MSRLGLTLPRQRDKIASHLRNKRSNRWHFQKTWKKFRITSLSCNDKYLKFVYLMRVYMSFFRINCLSSVAMIKSVSFVTMLAFVSAIYKSFYDGLKWQAAIHTRTVTRSYFLRGCTFRSLRAISIQEDAFLCFGTHARFRHTHKGYFQKWQFLIAGSVWH